MTTEAKFNPGQVVTTRPVSALMARDPAKHDWVTQQLARHLSGDWGDLESEAAAAMNDAAINCGSKLRKLAESANLPFSPIFAINGEDRIFSAYNIPSELDEDQDKIWIITEWDRSATTILFPSEY